MYLAELLHNYYVLTINPIRQWWCTFISFVIQELLEQIKKLENEKERDIIISQKLHRTLIATRRVKLRELQDKYKVIIIFPPPSKYSKILTVGYPKFSVLKSLFWKLAENSEIVKIKGQKDEVDACYKELSAVVKELNENSYSQMVPIYKQFHKFIIGKGGVNIRKVSISADWDFRFVRRDM